MAAAGLGAVQVRQVLSPAWTTDWISAEGRQKLQAYGIAPPPYLQSGKTSVCCPNCGSDQTELLSYFGSTACKSLYRCKDCLEPFDQFKCH
jgi:ring-1,2-phenylacetyl-CoA epoxidase subunit PaaD